MGDIFFGKMGEEIKRLAPALVGIQRLGGSLTVEIQHYSLGDQHLAFFTFGSGREHERGQNVFTFEPGREDRVKVDEVDYYMGHGIERG